MTQVLHIFVTFSLDRSIKPRNAVKIFAEDNDNLSQEMHYTIQIVEFEIDCCCEFF